jgi:hypothetical protein
MIKGFKGWISPQPSARKACGPVDTALVTILAAWIVVTCVLFA